LSDIDAELEKLAMNPWYEWIGETHLANELMDFQRVFGRPPRGLDFPAPIRS
jgi:hypothetical protein